MLTLQLGIDSDAREDDAGDARADRHTVRRVRNALGERGCSQAKEIKDALAGAGCGFRLIVLEGLRVSSDISLHLHLCERRVVFGHDPSSLQVAKKAAPMGATAWLLKEMLANDQRNGILTEAYKNATMATFTERLHMSDQNYYYYYLYTTTK